MTNTATPNLVTIPNVEIVEVGEEWQVAAPGPITITPDHIAKFLAGIDNDPAVKAPRVRFGHTTDWPGASEPSFGVYTNLRAENDGQTLVGDLAGVPAWFADIAPAAWPSRSIDGFVDATTHTGNHYPLLITAVSFLGVVLPGINTLEDLAAVWNVEPPEGTEVEAGTPIYATRRGAMPQPIAAAVGTDDVRNEFYEDFAQGDRFWWWIRQMFLDPAILIVDDDEGGLWAVDYTINATPDAEDAAEGDVAVEFGEPYEVVTQYVRKDTGQVAAALAERLQNGSQAAAVYANAGDSRPQDRNKEAEMAERTATAATTTEVDREALIKRLGLGEDASDEEIQTALEAEAPEGDEEENPNPSPGQPPAEEPAEEEAPEGDEPEGDEATATRTVPKQEWDDTQRRLAAHDKRELERERTRRDGVVSAAVKEGRIARARAKAWRSKFDADPEGTETLLTAAEDKGGLPTNLVPVEETGAGDGDPLAGASDAMQEAFYSQHFPELAGRNNGGGN